MQSQVTFNKIPEKVPEKVWEGCRARLCQQGSGEGSGEGLAGGSEECLENVPQKCGRLWCIRFNRVPEKVAEAKPGQVHLTLRNPAEVFPALGFAARLRKICKNKTLRLLGIPLKLILLTNISSNQLLWLWLWLWLVVVVVVLITCLVPSRAPFARMGSVDRNT